MSGLGLSGRLAQYFQSAALTPLLALTGLLLGFFAIAITPKEEEPQIDITFANVFIAYPGASAQEVEHLISTPAEQVLSELPGIDHIFSVSNVGLSTLTIAFKVGIPRQQALVQLYNQIYSHQDWLPANLGIAQPIIKPKGIDDVPIMSLTLWSESDDVTQADLSQVAHSLEIELKKIQGTQAIYTLGEHNQQVRVALDPLKLNAYQLSLQQVQMALQSSNQATGEFSLHQSDGMVAVQAQNFLTSPEQLSQLVVGVYQNAPIYLTDIGSVLSGADEPDNYVMMGRPNGSVPAVTLSIAKQAGQNAIDITQAVRHKIEDLKNKLIPADIQVTVSRDYGATAKEKSDKLIGKLLFATAAVIVLVLLALSWREAIIVGSAIIITLLITLFASWAWGFTLNRVSLFALIFSIGILVDDAIVVVENVHRHLHLGHGSLIKAIPKAVNEVGGPTILATLTVIAALMPMAFVSGLMGPYMSPIPINASTGMLISLLIALTVTPWLCLKLLKHDVHHGPAKTDQKPHITQRIFGWLLSPFLLHPKAVWLRAALGVVTLLLIGVALWLPMQQWVVLKMLPFDNKSELQVIVDMPEGTPLQDTLALMDQLGHYIGQQADVEHYQLYAGTASPINFNGLLRQYYLRQLPHQGDIQVNLLPKHQREQDSHSIALALREPLQQIGQPYQANIKIVEVPPGPPVMSPIVAEVYAATPEQRQQWAQQVLQVFQQTPDLVDIDSTLQQSQKKWLFQLNRSKANLMGISQQQLIETIHLALQGGDIGFLHQPQQKFAVPIRLQLNPAYQADLQHLLNLNVYSASGNAVPLGELLIIHETEAEPAIYHKDLQPVTFVMADMAGTLDSPLYGMFSASQQLQQQYPALQQTFIAPPDQFDAQAIKWDGEWQITYETFRDMGIAYAVGMLLIYLLVVAQFRSYITPLVIMAPIPLTVIGVMPGHAIMGAQFTATSMIGMIALAGIIVRNSILLVDFINQELASGSILEYAVIKSATVRAQPILLTGIAAMTGAFFILDDPIFNGLAISLIFGILISTLLTLLVIPVLYYAVLKTRGE